MKPEKKNSYVKTAFQLLRNYFDFSRNIAKKKESQWKNKLLYSINSSRLLIMFSVT